MWETVCRKGPKATVMIVPSEELIRKPLYSIIKDFFIFHCAKKTGAFHGKKGAAKSFRVGTIKKANIS